MDNNIKKSTIAIIDDETDILELVSINLIEEGFIPRTFENGATFFEALKNNTIAPHLILLDLMLPDINGKEICKMLKANNTYQDIPIIILTAKETEVDKVLGLELGADDYITKPFSSKELCARIKAVLRRSTHKEQSAFTPNDTSHTSADNNHIIYYNDSVIINTKTHEVYVDDKNIAFTYTEFKILLKLLEKPQWTVSRNELLEYLWSNTKIVTERTIDVHIKHIRDKLGVHGSSIKNIRGIGYKIAQ